MPTIIVPYRNRKEHLDVLLPVLKKQAKNWNIVIVEQADNEPFNRGKLLNIGVIEAKDDYYILHDVDMIPQNNPYQINNNPISLVKTASQFPKNGRPYDRYFGGVTGISRKHFLQVNGFYNDFWGWGAEDDLLLDRIELANIQWNVGDGEFDSLYHDSNLNDINGAIYREQKTNLQGGLKQCLYDVISDEIIDGVRYIKVNTKPINKTITITAYNRPQYFEQICRTLRANKIQGYRIVVAFEPSDKFEKQKAMLDTILNDNDEIWRAVWYKNAEKKGVRKNPYDVLDYVFSQLKSEINIYLEDDIIISPDVTQLAEWFYNYKEEKEILSVKLVNESCKKLIDDETLLLCENEYSALGMIIKKDSWFKYYKPNWFQDVGMWQGQVRTGWDWMIHRGVLEPNVNLYTLMPVNSRSNHTGREGGTHCSPQGHDEVFFDVKVNDSIPKKYVVVNQIVDQITPTF
jgi:hypothetical protein